MLRRGLRGSSVLALVAIVAWSVLGVSPATAARARSAGGGGGSLRFRDASSEPAVPGKLSAAQKRALSRGYLVPDEGGYARTKVAAAQNAPANASRRAAVSPRSPAFDGAPLRSWQGVEDSSRSPTDSTGTIGLSRYIEIINSVVAFYDRTHDAPLSTASLATLAGESGNLFDPYMIWDPGTNRFYYVMDNAVSSTDNRLEMGFSKTATPSSAADFCKYKVTTGADFYDYPKLGDTSNLWMVGANVFDAAENYLRSDVVALTKPAAGSTCPLASTFTLTVKSDLRNANATPAFTPVPVNQTDSSGTGWIVSAPSGSPRNFLSVFQVTRNGNAMVVGAPKTVSVATFASPANAVQKGSTSKLDTLDGRLTNAVSAIDPSRDPSTSVGIWTQHAVSGGAGSEVRWYEINPAPATPVPFQNGTAGSSALFSFNAAISPDRRVNGAARNFGSSMVLGFNTSSSTQFLDIRSVSKRGTHGQSGQEVIKAGTAPQSDFTCTLPGFICRSGDYSGASPDPASDTSASDGVVWLTNQFPGTNWHTWNFAGRPSAAPK